MLKSFIEDYLKVDTSRSNKSNLIKLLISDKQKFEEIDNFICFGTFKQKLYHYLNDIRENPKCLICKNCDVKWVEKDFKYRETCSSICSGKLNLFRNNPDVIEHPKLNSKEDYYIYFSSGKLKIIPTTISKYYPEIIENVSQIEFVEDFNQKVYCFLKNITELPFCKNCQKNKVQFENFSKGYREFCSIKCSSNSEEKKDRIKNTNLEKYGYENISSVTRDKALDTMIEKYGSHISLTESYKMKYKNTSIERYGVEHPFQCSVVKNKIVDSLLKNYGTTNALKNPEILKKSLDTRQKNGFIFKWSEEDLKKYENYRRKVTYLSEKSYQRYKSEINPNNLDRGHLTYHLDHIYPVILGFINQIDVELISHHKNLQILPHEENRAKNDKTELSLEDFYNLVENQ